MEAGHLEVRLVESAGADAGTLKAARALLDDVFADLTEHDWEHCLGGVHALVWDTGDLVGHGSVVPRQLLHAGRTLEAGYVEGLAVRPDRRGRGYGAAIMASLEEYIRALYEIGALSSTDMAATLYRSRGWVLWKGPTSAMTPSGIVPTPDDDGGIYVLPVSAAIDVTLELTCDWRAGDLW